MVVLICIDYVAIGLAIDFAMLVVAIIAARQNLRKK